MRNISFIYMFLLFFSSCDIGEEKNGHNNFSIYLPDENLYITTSESGMIRDGVGYKVYLNGHVGLNRTGLRIHPDQNPALGTAECIGITENSKKVMDFRNVIGGYFNGTSKPINVKINFNNPKYNQPKGGRTTSGQ